MLHRLVHGPNGDETSPMILLLYATKNKDKGKKLVNSASKNAKKYMCECGLYKRMGENPGYVRGKKIHTITKHHSNTYKQV
jgi:hypothetical protein